MFSINDINFANGVMSGNRVNGLEVMIMESSEKADNVINDFEKAFQAGMNPNNVLEGVLYERNYKESDFTNTDIVRINRKIDAIYKSNKGHH